MKILSINAKCSDLFTAQLIEKLGANSTKRLGQSIDGDYVPGWFPNPQEDHYGDYVTLDIDIETGKILNWKKPTAADLKKSFQL